MKHQRVTSREYKLMLRCERFRGNQDDVIAAGNLFWKALSRHFDDVGLSWLGVFKEVKMRSIVLLDTPAKGLNNAHYILRDRVELTRRLQPKRDTRELTLKFRHPDRYVAQDRNIKAARRLAAKTKFEEDIKAPFTSLYSFSTTIKWGTASRLSTLRAVASAFPRLGKIGDLRSDAILEEVGKCRVHEMVATGARLRMARTPKLDAECALIVWYRTDADDQTPLAAEFSYRYRDEQEAYRGTGVLHAFGIFRALQSDFSEWLDPESRTKTAVMYRQAIGGA